MAEKGSWATITTALERTVGHGRPAGAWTRYCCPSHEADGSHHKPSLGIKYDDAKQRTVVKCFAGCDDAVVLDKLGLAVRDLFDGEFKGAKRQHYAPPRRTQRADPAQQAIDAAGLPLFKLTKDMGKQLSSYRVAATYDYPDLDGTVVGQVVRREARFENGTVKTFHQQRWNSETGHFEPGGFAPIPFQAPQLRAAIDAGQTIYIVEGEKDVLNAARAGLTATCNVGGARKWTPAHAQWLRDATEVVIVADRDAPGYRHADQVMRSLTGLVGRVRVMQAATGKDLSDHLECGHDIGELEPVRYLDPLTPPSAPARELGGTTMTTPVADPTSITVYTKADCVQCDATKNMLDRIGAPYRVVDLEADPASRARLKELGLLSAPVVEAGEIRFTGFRPERLKALASSIRPEPPPSQPNPQPQSIAESGTVDLDAVRQWAAPYLRSAQRRGEIPAVGSPAWVALPNGDPRKTGAIVQAALDQATAAAIAPAPARSAFDHVIQRSATAAAAPLKPPALADAPSPRALAAAPADHLAPARQHTPARTR